MSESDPHAHVAGDAAYYGPFTGGVTVASALTDATSGLDAVTFPATVNAGETYPQEGAHQAAVSHVYTFNADDDFSNDTTVTASDRATNETTETFAVVRDAVSPTLSLDAAVQDDAIIVAWSASDADSGIYTCTLEVREDEGAWESLSTACAGETTYAGEPAHRYTFRLSASDNVGNEAIAETQEALSRVTKYYYHSGQRVAMRRGNVVYYVHADHLGSTSLVTCGSADCDGKGSGEMVSRQLYHPYGTVRWSEGTLPTDFGFTGQKAVPGTGLMHYGARFYDPYINRFISADTIVLNPGNPQEWNRYAYVLNNPLRFIDPSGHQIEPPTYQPNAIQHTGTAGAQVYNSSAIFQVNPTQVSYPSVQSIEALVVYHEYQGVGTTTCGDHSVAMAYNVWLDRTTAPPPGSPPSSYKQARQMVSGQRKSGSDITPLIDSRFLGRFPIVGGATPGGIDYALEQLGVPFYRDTLGDNMDSLRYELYEGHPVILSTGAVAAEPGEQMTWGHVIVAVGYDPKLNRYAFLDPGRDPTDPRYKGANLIRWMTEAELRDEWWYSPFNPMWVVGEEE